jgi:hypothetical protein
MEKYHPSCRLPKIMMVQTGKNRHLQDHALPLRTISLRNSLFNPLVQHSRADGFAGIPYFRRYYTTDGIFPRDGSNEPTSFDTFSHDRTLPEPLTAANTENILCTSIPTSISYDMVSSFVKVSDISFKISVSLWGLSHRQKTFETPCLFSR